MGILSALNPFGRREPNRVVRAAVPGTEFYSFGDPRFLEYVRGGAGGETAAGIYITPKQAMKNTTVFRCVSLLSYAIGMLPLQLRDAQTKEVVRDHSLRRALQYKPNGWMTPFEFRVFMQQSALGAMGDGRKGDAYARIVRSRGNVIGLIPLHPDRVDPIQRDDMFLEYKLNLKDGSEQILRQEDVFHLRCGLTEDGISGLSSVKQSAEAIALAIQTERASARLFKNGILAGGTFVHPTQLSPEAYDRLKSQLDDKRGADGAHKELILEGGMDYKGATTTAEQSQAVESRRLQVEEISRPYGVPRPLLNVDDTSWGSGIGELGQLFIRYGLNPWFTAWEQAVKRSLLSEAEAEKYEVAFDSNVLSRGSLSEQADFFVKGLGAGGHHPFLHPDEPREMLNLPKRDDLPAPMGAQNGGENEQE